MFKKNDNQNTNNESIRQHRLQYRRKQFNHPLREQCHKKTYTKRYRDCQGMVESRHATAVNHHIESRRQLQHHYIHQHHTYNQIGKHREHPYQGRAESTHNQSYPGTK